MTVDLNRALSEARPMPSGFLRSRCPFCWELEGSRPRKLNFAINPETGSYSCWKCSKWGRFSDLSTLANLKLTVVKVDQFEPPESFVALRDVRDNFGEHLGAYLYVNRTRGVSDEAIDACEIGHCTTGQYAGCVVIPVKEFGEWRGFVARKLTKSEYRYPSGMQRGSLFFNGDALWQSTDEPIMLVEGCLDALPYWPNAVAVLGKPSAEHKRILQSVKRPLAICMDADAQGTGWALAEVLKLQGVNAKYISLPPGYDPAEVDPVWFHGMVENAFQ